MSESKHTPGPLTVKVDEKWPWRIRTYNSSGEEVFEIGMPCFTSADKCKDDAINCVNFNPADRERCAAMNERAIADEVLRAAAPDLLEALQAMLDEDDGGRAADQARAAIAKAKGERQ